jgi:tRNA-(ms[2]io[6]A)-hydroxylase
MLNLHAPTPATWITKVGSNLEELLLDHAHCEKKAAGVAMNLLFSYVDQPELARAMTGIVREELEHFEMVLGRIQERGWPWRKLRPSRYGERLHGLIRRDEPGKAVDRLLVAALIEARSCERFGILRDHLADRDLANFFGSLYESEARHHGSYVQLAQLFATRDEVRARLAELAEAEAAIILEGEPLARVHS